MDDTPSIPDSTCVLKNDESSDEIKNSLNNGASETVLEKDSSDKMIASNEPRLSKRAKIQCDEGYSINHTDNGNKVQHAITLIS